MTLGTFPLLIDGEQLGGTEEDTATLFLSIQGRGAIRDEAADKFIFPNVPGRGSDISLPYTIELPTDVTSGTSTEIGYSVTVRTDNGGVVSADFAAQAATTTPVPLTDLAETVVTPISDLGSSVAAAEAAQEAAETAAASVQREQASGVAGLTAAGKLYEARIPDRLSDASLSAAIAAKAKLARPALRILMDGDSIAAQCLTDAAQQALGYYDAYGWTEWANAALSGRLSVVANEGVGGQRTSQILARINTSLARDYDVVILSALTNDLFDGTGTTVATMKTNIAAIYDAHLAAGKTVVHMLPGPSTFATSTTLANQYEMHRWLRDYARDHPGIILFDGYAPAADPTDGKPLQYYCRPGDDLTNFRGVHPGYPWAAKLGKELANVLEPLVSRIPVVESPSNADPRNVLTNGKMLGSTGGLATGYTVIKNADGSTATYTATKTARPDGRPGEVQQIVIPSASWASEVPVLFIQDTTPGGRWNVGDTVRLVAHFETDPDTAGSYPGAPSLTFWNGLGAVSGYGKRGQDTTAPHSIPAGIDVHPRKGMWATTWGVVPSGTGRLQARVPLPYGTTRILSYEIQKAV